MYIHFYYFYYYPLIIVAFLRRKLIEYLIKLIYLLKYSIEKPTFFKQKRHIELLKFKTAGQLLFSMY